MRLTFLVLSVLISILLLSSLGCKNVKSNTDPVNELLEIDVTSEEELVVRCAPWFIVNPTSKEEMDINEVINVIIDNKWNLEKSTDDIFYTIKSPGSGKNPKWGDKVSVHYTGYNLQGVPFDSSRKRKLPFEFYIGNVIDGWNVALPMLSEGGRGIFFIPAHKAYGEEGFGNKVAPGEHIIFDIELLNILR